jgi:hypothetical protein
MFCIFEKVPLILLIITQEEVPREQTRDFPAFVDPLSPYEIRRVRLKPSLGICLLTV